MFASFSSGSYLPKCLSRVSQKGVISCRKALYSAAATKRDGKSKTSVSNGNGSRRQQLLRSHPIVKQFMQNAYAIQSEEGHFMSRLSSKSENLQALCDEALHLIPSLAAQDRAELLKCCAIQQFVHLPLIKTLISSFTTKDDPGSIAIAISATYNLRFPVYSERLVPQLWATLRGNCSTLTFQDLKVCIAAMSEIKRRKHFPEMQICAEQPQKLSAGSDPHSSQGFRGRNEGSRDIVIESLETEICQSLVSTSSNVNAHSVEGVIGFDSRELLAIPFHLSILKYYRHPDIMDSATQRIHSLIVSRIRSPLLDAFLAYAGYLVILDDTSDDRFAADLQRDGTFAECPYDFPTMAAKCKMYCKFLLQDSGTDVVLQLPNELQSNLSLSNKLVELWVDEMLERRLHTLNMKQLGQLSSVFNALGLPTNQISYRQQHLSKDISSF